jgi:hypothetical protein
MCNNMHQIVAVGFITVLTSEEWEDLSFLFDGDVAQLADLRLLIRLDVYFAIKRHVANTFIASLYSGLDDKIIETSCVFDDILNKDYDVATQSRSIARLKINNMESFPNDETSGQFNGLMLDKRNIHYTSMMHAVACTWILNMYHPDNRGRYIVADKLISMEPACVSYVASILANYSRIEKHAAVFSGVIRSNIYKYPEVYKGAIQALSVSGRYEYTE